MRQSMRRTVKLPPDYVPNFKNQEKPNLAEPKPTPPVIAYSYLKKSQIQSKVQQRSKEEEFVMLKQKIDIVLEQDAVQAVNTQQVLGVAVPNEPTNCESCKMDGSSSTTLIFDTYQAGTVKCKVVVADPFVLSSYGPFQLTFKQGTKTIHRMVNVCPEEEHMLPQQVHLVSTLNQYVPNCKVVIKYMDAPIDALNGQVLVEGCTNSEGIMDVPVPKCPAVFSMAVDTDNDASLQNMSYNLVWNGTAWRSKPLPFVPRLLENEEIVLRWSAKPRDLDSHLFCSDGGHVYFNHKEHENDEQYISLDCDVTKGRGPETMQFNMLPNHTYVYAVHNFSHEYPMVHSMASVTCSDGTQYQIPALQQYSSNLYWIVCKYDGNTKKRILINAFCNDEHEIEQFLQ